MEKLMKKHPFRITILDFYSKFKVTINKDWNTL